MFDFDNEFEELQLANSFKDAGELNPSQLQAVCHTNGPLLILAGAGTGKTKVLTNRIAHLINNGFAYTNNILAVTFTNKAAKEMYDRINNLIDAQGLNIGTFHSIAVRMLRSHIELLGIGMNKNFTIIDPDDQVKLVKNLCQQENIDHKTYAPKALHSIISRWKDQGIMPDKLGSSDCISVIYTIAKKIYGLYQQQLQNSNAADFGDLLLYCNKLLIDHQHILEYYQDKFKYILIDEYQDTNAVQYVWARMLAQKHKNICCVGDDDQSIYSWRGAEVRNILRFSQDFANATIIKLEQNYRSSPNILAAAAAIIKHNKQRHHKTLWTDKIAGEPIQIITFRNDKEEARWVVTAAAQAINAKKYGASSIAILVRAGFQTRAFEEVFISNAIPYQIIGGLRFYERMEIRDVLAYIRLSVNQDDNLALERIINVPKRSIGNVTLSKIKEFAANSNISLFKALKYILSSGEIKGKSGDSLKNFVDIIEKASKEYLEKPAFEVTKYILEATGYLAILKEEKTDEARGRIENIHEMLKAINEFDNILEFIEHSSLVMDNDALESDFGGTVKIMTLHAAKGLEFDLVFLPGWEENLFPHQKAILEEGEKGLEEERRIAYVGITRAKKELIISHAETRRVFHEFVNSIPSRFLHDIPDELCKKNNTNRNINYLGSNHSFSMNNNGSFYRNTHQNFQASSPSPASKNGYESSNSHIAKSSKNNNSRVGSKVRHEKFGYGIVIKQNGDNLDIAFENVGIKTIKESYIRFIDVK